jgi:hypothetical protein
MTLPPASVPGAAVIDGVDVDAVAAAVLACPGVAALDGGQYGEVASYLPGRKVAGVMVSDGRVKVQVRLHVGPVPPAAFATFAAAGACREPSQRVTAALAKAATARQSQARPRAPGAVEFPGQLPARSAGAKGRSVAG